MPKEKNVRNEGFFVGLLTYFIIMYFSRYITSLLYLVLMPLVPSPGMQELEINCDVLFNVSYPILGFVVFFIYIIAVFLICFFVAQKFAFKHEGTLETRYIVLQFVIILLIVGFMGIRSTLENNMMDMCWYLGAACGNIFGLIDKATVMAEIDINLNTTGLIATQISYKFAGWILAWEIIMLLALVAAMWFGRSLGAKSGLSQRLVLRQKLFDEAKSPAEREKE